MLTRARMIAGDGFCPGSCAMTKNATGMAQEYRSAVQIRWLALGMIVGSAFSAVISIRN